MNIHVTLADDDGGFDPSLANGSLPRIDSRLMST